jgi:GNAT superfamily N-acetyltransferase
MSSEPSSIVLPDGYADVPAGKIAAVVTYLEMSKPPRRGARRNRAVGLELAAIGSDPERYLALFRRVGEPWLWFSRLVMPEAELRDILASPDVDTLALRRGGEDIGLLELDFRRPDECELAFLGVVPEAIGTGAGRFLVETAAKRAFARPLRRFWCIPAPSTTTRPWTSTGARVSRPTGAPSKSPTTRACPGSWRGAPRPMCP